MNPTHRCLCLIALLPFAVGCLTSAPDFVGGVYYYYGPEAALEAADLMGSSKGGRSLVELERSMALLELGWYRESLSALRDARSLLEANAGLGSAADGGRALWRPESHETVLIATMEMVASLALQDATGASAAADRAIDAMAEADCGRCDFTFTRVVAALAFEAAGRYADGRATLAGVEIDGEGVEVLDGIRRGLEAGLVGAEPEGMAPPPVERQRSVVLLLLMGRGPYKAPDELRVTDAKTIPWATYLPREPQRVSRAMLELDDEAVAVELTDVEELAAAALSDRAERVAAAGGVGCGLARLDLRHWWSLPSTMDLVVSEIPDDAEFTDLVFFSPDADEIGRETIEWPTTWTGGRIFVVRRVP